MAKTWSVSLPITGTLCVEVEAEDKKAAIEAALNGDHDISHLETWSACRQIVTGNIFHGERNGAEAELVDDGEDED